MKKTLRSQLLAAVSLLIIAAVALTGATYAWFTAVKNPEVDNIDLTVRALSNLLLSEMENPNSDTGHSDWKAVVTQANIMASSRTTNKYAFPTELTNVSSLFKTNTLTVTTDLDSRKFWKIVYDLDGMTKTGYELAVAPGVAPTTPGTDPVLGDYAKFDLWVISADNGMFYLDVNNAMSHVKQALTDTDLAKYYTDATVRVGFVPQNYDIDDTSGVDTFGSAINPGATTGTENFDHAIIWEPNETKHLPSTFNGVGGTGIEATSEAAYGIDSADYETQSTFKLTVEGAGAVDGKMDLFQLAKGRRQLFSVYIWVEGADVDTLNAVANHLFSTRLVFGQKNADADTVFVY